MDRTSYDGYFVTLSTTALSECTKEAINLQSLIRELSFVNLADLVIYCDNRSSVKMAYHAKSKHIDIRHHFVREAIKTKSLDVEYISAEEQVADFLTKSLRSWCTKSAGVVARGLEGKC